MRQLSYVEALNEALHQLLEADSRVLLIGQGVNSPWYVGRSTRGLSERFGPTRVIDTPICEDSVTGAAVGAALAGLRPIVVHPRIDFALLAMEQLVGQAANWHYMSGGRVRVPMVAWLIVNRGGEQAAQHSQSLHAYFAHAPGLKVIVPATPYDVKGLLIAGVQDDDPVVFVDDRWLYQIVGPVPEEMVTVPIGQAALRREGRQLTIVANSYLAVEAERAAEELAQTGIDAEVVDLRTIRPIDTSTILTSVRKTGYLLVVDGGWAACGLSAEVAAIVAESDAVGALKAPIQRLTLPPAPAPMASTLEAVYFRRAKDIVAAARKMLRY